jgi:hypothetical protein
LSPEWVPNPALYNRGGGVNAVVGRESTPMSIIVSYRSPSRRRTQLMLSYMSYLFHLPLVVIFLLLYKGPLINPFIMGLLVPFIYYAIVLLQIICTKRVKGKILLKTLRACFDFGTIYVC